MRRAGRWYPLMMSIFGGFTIALVAALPLVDDDATGLVFGLVVAAWTTGLARWKSRHQVRPATRKHTLAWVGVWLVLYVAAVMWLGPTYLEPVVWCWALMGAVVSVPAFIEAGRSWTRVRQ